MFKSIFGNKTDSIIFKTVDIAFDGKNNIESLKDSFTIDEQAELYLFNFVYGWIYIKDNDIIELNYENVKQYTAYGSITMGKIKPSFDTLIFRDLFLNRYEKYGDELSSFRKSLLTESKNFPIYFYNRIYNYPLILTEIPEIIHWDEDYENEMLIRMYINHVNYIQDCLDKEFRKK